MGNKLKGGDMMEDKTQIIIETTKEFKENAVKRGKELGFNLSNYIKMLIAQDLLEAKREKINENIGN